MLVPIFFDFNLTSLFRRVWLRHMADQTLYERRPHRFRPIAGLVAQIRIRQVCSTLSRQLPRPQVDQLRTVCCHGFCPIDLAREFARHRNMSARSGIQTLSQRYSPTHRSQYAGRRKAAIKLHTLLSLQGNFPTVVIITPGSVHDVNILDQLVYEAGSFYIMDRGYLDFARLHRIQEYSAFFVTRAKKNFRFQRRYSRPVDKSTGLRFDQTVELSGFYAQRAYPETLRRIAYRDPQTGKALVFLTNNFTVPALVIAQLYHGRWHIELFFKWIKQHLRIKAFYGTSQNAVRTQIWIAISVYLLVAILKKRLHLDLSLYTILQILSLTLFEKMPISQALSQPPLSTELSDSQIQPWLPGFLTGQ